MNTQAGLLGYGGDPISGLSDPGVPRGCVLHRAIPLETYYGSSRWAPRHTELPGEFGHAQMLHRSQPASESRNPGGRIRQVDQTFQNRDFIESYQGILCQLAWRLDMLHAACNRVLRPPLSIA